jgi:hypothetical protein
VVVGISIAGDGNPAKNAGTSARGTLRDDGANVYTSLPRRGSSGARAPRDGCAAPSAKRIIAKASEPACSSASSRDGIDAVMRRHRHRPVVALDLPVLRRRRVEVRAAEKDQVHRDVVGDHLDDPSGFWQPVVRFPSLDGALAS